MKTLKLGVALIALAVGFATSAFTSAPNGELVWFDVQAYSFKLYGTEGQALQVIAPEETGLIAYGYDADRRLLPSNPFQAISIAPVTNVVLSAQLLKTPAGLPTGNSLVIDKQLYR